jgi:hypothetical protein
VFGRRMLQDAVDDAGPVEEATQVGVRVLARGTQEAGQVRSHSQPQLAGERHGRILRNGSKARKGGHGLTLRLHVAVARRVCTSARRDRERASTAVGAYEYISLRL